MNWLIVDEIIKNALKDFIRDDGDLEGYSDDIDIIIDKLNISSYMNPESIISEFIENMKKVRALESILKNMDEDILKDDLKYCIEEIINNNINTFNCK